MNGNRKKVFIFSGIILGLYLLMTHQISSTKGTYITKDICSLDKVKEGEQIEIKGTLMESSKERGYTTLTLVANSCSATIRDYTKTIQKQEVGLPLSIKGEYSNEVISRVKSIEIDSSNPIYEVKTASMSFDKDAFEDWDGEYMVPLIFMKEGQVHKYYIKFTKSQYKNIDFRRSNKVSYVKQDVYWIVKNVEPE